MKKIIALFLILIPFSLFANGIDYSPFSVATTDNFLATKVSPAALGFGNAGGLGYAQYFEEGKFQKKYSLFLNMKHLGYCYENMRDTLNIHTLANGFNCGIKNMYLGWDYAWENSKFKKGDLRLSLLYRPFDFLSLGAVGSKLTNDDRNGKIGFALRPISIKNKFWNRLSLSCDIQYANKEWRKPILGLETELFNGIQLGGSYNIDEETFSANFSINFYKFKFGTSFTPNDDAHGLSYANISNKNFRTFLKKEEPNQFYNYKLKGTILEQKPKQKIGPFQIVTTKGHTIAEILKTIKELKENNKIKGIVFKSGNIKGGIAKYEEIKDALLNFKSAGKKIVCYFENIGNMNYALSAAVGDKIYLNPSGMVGLSGFSIPMPYLKELLDTLGIRVINFRSHQYKTAGNMLSESEMTEAEREMLEYYLNGIYEEMVSMIAQGRGISKEKVKELIDDGPYFVAKDALNAGLIDDIIYEDELEDKIKDEFDNAKIVKKYKRDMFRYDWSDEYKSKIAIIYATGFIHSGKGQHGKSIGSETMAKAIKSAREDKSIKGIIFRIDSGGGSALASDIICREIALCDSGKTAKPVVVSMSDVAGSGGYYIACKADKIVAEPSTVTGSIGVIGMSVNLERLYEKIHINIETVKKGKHADLGATSRKMTEEETEMINNAIESFYWDFVDKVAEGRGMTREEIHEIAQGRIWTGRQAKERGLVDELGGMDKGIIMLKKLAKIDKDVEVVLYPKAKPGFTISLDADLPGMKTEVLPEEIKNTIKVIEDIGFYADEEILYLMPYRFPDEVK
ncbi:MAG: signal peptide peptidase SppA [Candidatus Cloacimonadota bacterium]|nr:signal peptide peptidase SppA [Candidatus Cloacimonadota bacterium]